MKRLGRPDRRVWETLHAHSQGGICRLKNRTIADLARVHFNTVTRILRKLTALGFIAIDEPSVGLNDRAIRIVKVPTPERVA